MSDTNGTTPAPDGASTSDKSLDHPTRPPLPACPPWCTLPPDHDPVEETNDWEGRIHRSPDFGGLVRVDMDDVDGFTVSVHQEVLDDFERNGADGSDPLDAAALLEELAGAVLTAAEWLRGIGGVAAVDPTRAPMPGTDRSVAIECPEWCRLPDGHPFNVDDAVGPEDIVRHHEGPRFGALATEGVETLAGQLTVMVFSTRELEHTDRASLLAAATDYKAAAAWMAAVQSPSTPLGATTPAADTLSLPEAAERVSLPVRTLMDAVRAGELRTVWNGEAKGVREDDLSTWLNAEG